MEYREVAPMKKGRKTNIQLINDAVWNKGIVPKDYALSVSNEPLVFTEDFVNVSAADQMINAISKSRWPRTIILSHTSAKVLGDCVDWLIRYCELFGRLMPEVQATNTKIFDRIEDYQKQQVKVNKRRRKRKRYV